MKIFFIQFVKKKCKICTEVTQIFGNVLGKRWKNLCRHYGFYNPGRIQQLKYFSIGISEGRHNWTPEQSSFSLLLFLDRIISLFLRPKLFWLQFELKQFWEARAPNGTKPSGTPPNPNGPNPKPPPLFWLQFEFPQFWTCLLGRALSEETTDMTITIKNKNFIVDDFRFSSFRCGWYNDNFETDLNWKF